jgi:hypothetical protein
MEMVEEQAPDCEEQQQGQDEAARRPAIADKDDAR